jgi:hypothetical protein
MLYTSCMSNLTENGRLRHDGMFQPGQSGNLSGRPKADITIRELAKTYTEEAIETLAEIMRNPKASSATRVQASCALLDRGWGKPAQYIESVHLGLTYTDFLDRMAAQDTDDELNALIVDI